MAKKDYKPYQVRVNAYDAERLARIAKDYGFRSPYGLFRWVVFTFLRAADPDNDPMCDPLPLDIIELFDISEDAQLVHESILRVRRQNYMRKYMKERRKNGEDKPRAKAGDEISDEVAEMFAGYEAEGAQKEWKPNIQQRKGK